MKRISVHKHDYPIEDDRFGANAVAQTDERGSLIIRTDTSQHVYAVDTWTRAHIVDTADEVGLTANLKQVVLSQNREIYALRRLASQRGASEAELDATQSTPSSAPPAEPESPPASPPPDACR